MSDKSNLPLTQNLTQPDIRKYIYSYSQKQITQVLWRRISFRCGKTYNNEQRKYCMYITSELYNATRMRKLHIYIRARWVAIMGAFLHIYSSARQEYRRYIRLMNVDLKFTALIAVCRYTLLYRLQNVCVYSLLRIHFTQNQNTIF